MQEFWKDRNVFITGCTGLLGSHLTQSLVNKGTNVVGLVRDLVPHSDLIQSGVYDKINIVRGCVEDFFTVERILNEYNESNFYCLDECIDNAMEKSPQRCKVQCDKCKE